MSKYIYTLIFVILLSAFAPLALAQTGRRTTKPATKPASQADAKKAAQRPAAPARPAQLKDPFERATVAEMAGKCVRLDTELGNIEFEVFPESAPESVRNILNIAALGMLDTTTFSRVVPGFVIQGGDIWTRDGTVLKPMGDRAEKAVPDEPNKILHERGIVSMARTDDPNSATTHFFILVNKAPHLDGKFSAFGMVTKGMDVVDAINKAPVKDEKPDQPVKIKKAGVFDCTKSL